jgi:HEAT repeat protein
MKMRWLMWLGLVLALLAAGLLVEPTRVVWGYLHGESFYHGRPTSYWRGALLDQAPAVHVATRSALKEGGVGAVPVLIELLATEQGPSYAEVRWTVAELLRDLGPEAAAATPALLAALQDPDPHVRHVVTAALGEIAPADKEVIAALVSRLRTGDRLSAVKALGHFAADAREAVPTLVELVKDPDTETRLTAVIILGEIGPDAALAVRVLTEALRDADATVREHAAESLGQIGTEDASTIAALSEALKDNNSRVRRDAVRTLGQIGPAAKSAVPAIRGLQKDESENVRSAARTALRQIDPQASKDKGQK